MKASIERIGIATLAAATGGLLAWPAFVALFGDAGDPAAVRLLHPAIIPALLVAASAAWSAWRLLPAPIDGAARSRPVRATLWILLAVVSVVQTARLSVHLVDPESDWWVTTTHPFWAKHACMGAYFYAADLDRQGEENVYDAGHYPGLTPDVGVHPTIEHLVPEDPYQYPPQFLLLPRLAMAFSNDYHSIRAVWISLQALLFLSLAVVVARWAGGRAGRLALWLVPLLWISVPSLLNFQYGQFHVTTIALAVGALVAFERRRDALGGLLLAVAVLAKGFPGIVLLPMVLQGRWRSVGWTAGWAAAWSFVAWGVLGPEPFHAFVAHHVANLG
ncbi:DUF2029 domain-containing protein, partial [bacterium]|nr:DUF2029 domain-containing protein [bacterium]